MAAQIQSTFEQALWLTSCAECDHEQREFGQGFVLIDGCNNGRVI